MAVSGFGLRNVYVAEILTTPGAPVWVKIPSVESAAFELEVAEEEQWGDDSYQGVFYHSQQGTLEVETNKLDVAIMEMLSGNTASTDGGNDSLWFGTPNELTPPQVMVRADIPYRDDDGSTGVIRAYWFKADVTTLWNSIPGSTRAEIMTMTLNFNVFSSTKDEGGNAIPSAVGGKAFGRFVIIPDA